MVVRIAAFGFAGGVLGLIRLWTERSYMHLSYGLLGTRLKLLWGCKKGALRPVEGQVAIGISGSGFSGLESRF